MSKFAEFCTILLEQFTIIIKSNSFKDMRKWFWEIKEYHYIDRLFKICESVTADN
jgi:hypothetical protein